LCDRLEPLPNGIVIPSWVISSIVHAPGGARPSYVHGYYQRDTQFYGEWDAIARDRDRFLQWMEQNVLECVPA
jgi:glutaconate CoA-transferase, subunit A